MAKRSFTQPLLLKVLTTAVFLSLPVSVAATPSLADEACEQGLIVGVPDVANADSLSAILNSELFKAVMAKQPNSELWPSQNYVNRAGELLPVGRLYPVYKKEDGSLAAGLPCSASLVGIDLIVTAKHCNSMSREAAGMFFMLDDGTIAGVMPNETEVKQADYPYYHELGLDPAFDDIELMQIDAPLGQSVGYLKISSLTPAELLQKGEKLVLAGFPGSANSDHSKPGKYISESVCEISFIKDGVIHTNCVPAAGVSGGPLIYMNHGEPQIVGTLSSQTWIPSANIYGSRITSIFYRSAMSAVTTTTP